jgi:hypothetical protein
MIQGGSRPGFLDEPPPALRIGELRCRQDLESDEAVQASVAGFVNDSHATLAQLPDHLVVGNRLPDHRRSPQSHRESTTLKYRTRGLFRLPECANFPIPPMGSACTSGPHSPSRSRKRLRVWSCDPELWSPT